MSSPFPARKVRQLVTALAEEQNCTVVEKKKGYMVHFPGGGSIMVHLSVSDGRAIQNIKQDIRKAGGVWPESVKP